LARIGLASLLVLAALAVAAPAAAAGDVGAAHVIATLEPDGVVDLIQQVTLDGRAPTPARWEVVMQQGELFAQPSLVVNERRFVAGNGRRPGTYRVSRGSRGIRFDWLQPAGAGTARIGYRLALLGTAYSDVVDLRVPVWEGEWPGGVRRLTAALRLPRTARGRTFAWVEPDSLATTVTKTPNEIRMSASRVPEHTPVTLRVVVPRRMLTSLAAVNVRSGPALATILSERDGGGRSWWPWALVAGAAVVLSAAVLRTARSRRLRPR
jgi:Predicted membrane protein (DUF2207) N-terminal domain